MKRISFLIISFCFAFAGTVFAQPPGERSLKPVAKQDSAKAAGNTYAIIIGISDYKQVTDLQYADKDAQAFERFLLSEAGGKTPKANIETFINENATRNNIADAISLVIEKAKPGDRAYFFFAGHGDMEVKTQVENGLLLLYNSPDGGYFGMKHDVLEVFELKRYLSPLAENGIEMIFIVDACHSGNLKGGIKGVEQTGFALAAAWGKEFKILSCQPNELSLESAEWGGGRGLFSLQLEEGLKGLADMNNNGTITMAELQIYLQINVAKYSDNKQLPSITGDPSKPVTKVNPAVLAALKEEKAKQRPSLPPVKPKGTEDKYIDTLDATGKKLYYSYKKNLADKRLIWPKDTNALRDYRAFARKYPDNEMAPLMRRNLAAALNQRFDSIVAPLLKDQTSYSTRDECYYAAAELDSCLGLLGAQHYMYPNLKARKLFMDAMAITWALTESEYNISRKPDVEKSIKMLEESEELEPNAAYTVSALGTRYFFVYDYNKAFAEFQKYLDLRPNDFYSKYSLGLLYTKLKQYDKAAGLFNKLITENPTYPYLYSQLFEAYFKGGKYKEALACARQITSSVDSLTGLFTMGIYYSQVGNIDSAVHYYHLTAKYSKGIDLVYNNLGHIYFVHGQIDSASHYFNLALAADSTNAFPHFNLATIDAINGNYQKAIQGFARSIDYSPSFTEAFVTHLDLYFGKRYTINNNELFKEFSNKSHQFDIQYIGYTSVLYCFIRDSLLINNQAAFDYIFPQMFLYKDYDVLTWYHYACYKALKQDKKTALESLEKALKLGFGSYFMLTSDRDLDLVRDTPEFKSMLQKYFPAEVKKYANKKGK
ncbi:MAG: caspase family protein [Chitinophagaceae bacterium]